MVIYLNVFSFFAVRVLVPRSPGTRGVPPPRPGTRAPGPGCKEMLLPIFLYSSVIEWRKLSFEETLDFI